MGNKIKLGIIGVILAIGPAMPAQAQYDPYTQCLIDYCFHNYVNDPVGYESCRQWCARTSGGTYAKSPKKPIGKLH